MRHLILFVVFYGSAGTEVACPAFVVRGSPNYVVCKFFACPGETISASLCYAQSKCEGDTYLTLHNSNNTRVDVNDDYCGVCSALSYRVPASAQCGMYELRQGCFSAYCSGRTVVSVTLLEEKIWDPWFYENPMDHKGAIVTAWFIEVGIWGSLSLIQFIAHKKNYPSAVRKIGIFKAIVVFSLWFILEFSMLCARFNFYLQNENGNEYEPYRLGSGELVFLADDFFRASPRQLASASCTYEDIIGAHGHDAAYTCSFIYPLGPQLISQGYVQFSIGVQLIFIVFVQYSCLLVKILLLDPNSNGTIAANASCCLMCAFFEFVLNLHQFLILLPLTAVLPNEYCAIVQVPVSTERAICLFKIAAAMLPYGIPSVFGGCCILYVAYLIGKSGRKTDNVVYYLLSFIIGVAGLYFFATGLCMVIFWVFGGIFIGMWYGLEGASLAYSTAETALILNTMKCTPFLFSFFDVAMFPLPMSDEKSFYHLAYMKYVAISEFICGLYRSEPCCVDMCTWIMVRISTFELWISDRCGSCWDNFIYFLCRRSNSAQIGCEDIMMIDDGTVES